MFTQVFIKQEENLLEPLNQCNNYFENIIVFFDLRYIPVSGFIDGWSLFRFSTTDQAEVQ